ncbi:F-box protein At5g07670-like isoform X1 [Lycium barbarum]|uniref:F-box protein At5g07670-like isoform X1 n=1 Tax=Lycium barbarum TaxID=112863 RepID=UPI00293F061F|nr:F-box protein At5g07670-like isoform X1 [Lycium barbarum]
MPTSPPEENPKSSSAPPVRKRRLSLSEIWYNKDSQALKQLVLQMRAQSSVSNSTTPPSESELSETLTLDDPEPTRFGSGPDCTALLSDKLLLNVLSKVEEKQHVSNSLVCKRWCKLSGKLVRSIKLLDWEFLESGRLSYRFPGLIDIDLSRACVESRRNSGIVMSHRLVSLHLGSGFIDGGFVRKEGFLRKDVVDGGVKVLVEGCVNLRRIVLMNASEEGLSCLGEKCETLQELELYFVDDFAFKGLFGCRNLQILKLVGCIDGLYNSMVSDIGLTILAQGCKRLLKLELVGCEGSYDGIKAIGQCCQMLEELILCDHRMDGGWLSALSYCRNLKTLKLQCCKVLDPSPGPDEYLGSCSTLEELHLQQCQLRDKQGVRALFLVCRTVRELVLGDCWGLDNTIFAAASVCRSLRLLSLEGCSLLTTEGLDSVVQSWKELERLKVVACNNIKDSEITPELATLFSVLKELKWRPDSRSFLSSGLEGTGIGQKGGRSLRRK